MSKIRNRSVKTLPHEFANILNHIDRTRDKNLNYQDEDYFGENIKDVNATSPYVPFFKDTPPQSFSIMSNSDVDSITLDLNKLSGLSSSSSLSWSDEYESETTKKIQYELERMDRVLRREECIPPHYDKDEYEQWMNRFPDLSIFDTQITPVNSTQNIPKLIEGEEKQLIIYGNDRYSLLNKDCDNMLTSSNKKKKQPPVIDISDKLANGSLKQKSANIVRKRKVEENKNRSRNIFTIPQKPRSLDADKYLKISPIKNQASERRLSSKSLISREVCKEYPDISLEYNSLPFIKVEESNNSKMNTASSRSKNSSGQLPRRRLESHLILPPIVTSNQFRSISATPRQGKAFSALSVKFENFKNKKSSISLIENPISNR